jgi:hypothetical protein
MVDLKEALDELYELNELRSRAKVLRERGQLALKRIDKIEKSADGTVTLRASKPLPREEWISSGNNVEVGLLVKVQNHQDISEDDEENDRAEAAAVLKGTLNEIKLANLFPSTDYQAEIKEEEKGDRRVPVLVAARSMQALVGRSESVFSKATLLCYYRIIRELYVAAPPDWTIGAARAGIGGTTSAFVTGECIRAIFAFGDVMKHTARFFKQTDRLLGRYELLKSMLSVFNTTQTSQVDSNKLSTGESDTDRSESKSPMEIWADRAIERMWFDWYISTNPREGNIGLHVGQPPENQLFLNPQEPVHMESVGKYLDRLKERLGEAVRIAAYQITEAKEEIGAYRHLQYNFVKEEQESNEVLRKPKEGEERHFEKRLREYDRAESAHKFAFSLIEKALTEADSDATFIEGHSLKEIFANMEKRFTQMADDVQKVLEPSKRYIRTVLHREVASNDFVGRFDAGEMVFAAASYGAMTKWKANELLTRACNLLVESLPENGRLATTRPFHSTRKGHRMLPIGCEMSRSLAQLLQNTRYEFKPQLARRMINIFEEKLIELESVNEGADGKRVAWNFEGSPNPNSPCVWVTSVSVLALDRVVRMLNDRINSIVFKYFEVIMPEQPHSVWELNDLVYSDYGLSQYFQSPQPSLALRLEQMRAHVMRVTLPEMYRDHRNRKEKVFSAIFYGPPGTGKTTLVEALALSSKVPLIRLSPSDLVVQGPAAIEGRARAVFEALSMLTQVVIILDEFEDVVGHRVRDADKEKDDSKIFQFLRTGMLPKLVKLNDTARKQSFVYCLATNYLTKIEPAAKRHGRFDLCLPVYDPDPISRAGTLLYRLYRVADRLKHDGLLTNQPELLTRFLEVVEMTGGTRARSFADEYLRVPKWVYDHSQPLPAAYKNEITLFWYILSAEREGFDEKVMLAAEEKARTLDEIETFKKESASVGEQKEIKWLRDYEGQLKPKGNEKTISLEDLWRKLFGPSPPL